MNILNIFKAIRFFIFVCVIPVSCVSAVEHGDHDPVEKQSDMSGGILTGIVTRGPISPVERPGIPSYAPMSGVRLTITDMNERNTWSAVTDSEGKYRVRLPQGTYRVNISPLTHGEFTKDLPGTVIINEGKESHLDIRIDTGIR